MYKTDQKCTLTLKGNHAGPAKAKIQGWDFDSDNFTWRNSVLPQARHVVRPLWCVFVFHSEPTNTPPHLQIPESDNFIENPLFF